MAIFKTRPIKQNRGKPGIVSTLYAVYHCNNPITGQYLENYFEINTFLNNYLKPLVKRGAKNDMKVNNEDVLLGRIPLPQIDEQQQINVILDRFDHLITLKQTLVRELQHLKKMFLTTMFPRNGTSVPEIRFPGFTNLWDQRKLGEMGTTYTGLSGKTKEDFGHGKGQFVTYMNVLLNPISDLYRTDNVEIDTSQNKVCYGDVFFTTSSETPEEAGMSSVWLGNSDNTYLNSFCFGYRPNQRIDPFYLAYMLRSEGVREKITFLAQGISRYNISKTAVMDIAVPLPEMKEQIQLGHFFNKLEHLITLHQNELEAEQQRKKALMQLLLTGLVRVNV